MQNPAAFSKAHFHVRQTTFKDAAKDFAECFARGDTSGVESQS
jgi:hypothetical protein